MNEREIFAEAISQPDSASRASFLSEACGDDAALRRRIEVLLSSHEDSQGPLDCSPLELFGQMGQPLTPTSEAKAASDETSGTPAHQLAPFLLPSERSGALGRLGHYDVLEVLGQGGFGIVVKAFDETLQRVVAIKILAPNLAVTSPPRKRFLREARAGARISQENVVQIYAVEEHPLPYLVMEFIDGATVQQKLETDGPLEPAEVIRLGRQIALGLAAAHSKGLIHRDVKPGNILLDRSDPPIAKLTDFGLARTSDDASRSHSGLIAGTPMYMSPEQALGQILDHRADLFSLGSVLYAMVTGRPPFRAPSTVAILKRVVEDKLRPIREVIADVPEDLCVLITRLLEKKPEDRFASAREVADALASCRLGFHPDRVDDDATVELEKHATNAKRVAMESQPTALGRSALLTLAVLTLLAWLGVTGWTRGWWGSDRAVVELDPAANQTSQTSVEPEPVTTPVTTPASLNEPAAVMAKIDEPASIKPAPAANDIVVTSLIDDGSKGTLRWAISEANSKPGPDNIVFDAETFRMPQTVSITQDELVLTDTDQTTITGPSAGVTIRRGNYGRLFSIAPNSDPAKVGPVQVMLRGLTLAGGELAPNDGSRGAGIINDGDLVLDRVTMIGHRANFGAAITNHGSLRISNSAFVDNNSTNGGAILNMKNLTVINSTFTKNAAAWGPALHNYGTATFINCTLHGNTGDHCGGISHDPEGNGSVTVLNSIVAGNPLNNGERADLFGTMTVKNSLIGDASKATLLSGSEGNITGILPRLGSLGLYGGSTLTFPVLDGSPAIDAGNNSHLTAANRTDQRGSPRIAGASVDIGAFEDQPKP